MARNLNIRRFKRNGSDSESFTVPAGVKQLQVTFKNNLTEEDFYATAAISDNGSVHSWGQQPVGDGSATNRSQPNTIATNVFKTPFLKPDGTMYNWGVNTYGQVGDGSTTTRLSPVPVSGGIKFKKVRRAATCIGLGYNGNLYAWGKNTEGQLGQGDTLDRSTPTQVMPGTTFVDFWASDGEDPASTFTTRTVWARDTSGNVWGWGWGGASGGLIGSGALGSVSSPEMISGGLKFRKIKSNSYTASGHAIGLTDNNKVYCWGLNGNGQLGDNTIVSKTTPVEVVGGPGTYRDIAVGIAHSAAIGLDGNLYCWGDNSQGQLATNNILPKSTPNLVTSVFAGAKIYKVQSTLQSVYAITEDRKLYAWGYQDTLYPILGTNDTAKKSVPTLVTGLSGQGLSNFPLFLVEPVNPRYVHLLTGWPGIDTYANGVYGIIPRWSWGDNTAGQLGLNFATPRTSTAATSSTLQYLKPMPDAKTNESVVEVTPGQTLTVLYGSTNLQIPELGLESSFLCDEVILKWIG